MKNKPATTTTTTSQERAPWAPTVQPLKDQVANITALGGNVANFTPTYSNATHQGIQGLQNAAATGSDAQASLGQIVPGSTAGFNLGLGQLASMANGDYLNANRYLDPVVQKAMADTASRVNSQFTAAGRYGSGAHTGALTRELGALANNAYLSNYQTERQNQNKAADDLYRGGFQGGAMAGALDQSKLWAPGVQLQAGGLQDQIDNSKRMAPLNAAQWTSQMLLPIAQQGGSSSGTSTSQTVQPVNPITQGLGIAQMGLGLLGSPMTGGASLGLLGSGRNSFMGGGLIGNGMSLNGGGAVPGLPWTW